MQSETECDALRKAATEIHSAEKTNLNSLQQKYNDATSRLTTALERLESSENARLREAKMVEQLNLEKNEIHIKFTHP